MIYEKSPVDSVWNYGRMWDKETKKIWRANRLVWTRANGPIPEGMFVCHTCDNPACINIDHLFLDTPGGNMRDKASKGRHHNTKKTHCKRGHPFDEENTSFEPKYNRRVCRQCVRDNQNKYRALKKKAL